MRPPSGESWVKMRLLQQLVSRNPEAAEGRKASRRQVSTTQTFTECADTKLGPVSCLDLERVRDWPAGDWMMEKKEASPPHPQQEAA